MLVQVIRKWEYGMLSDTSNVIYLQVTLSLVCTSSLPHANISALFVDVAQMGLLRRYFCLVRHTKMALTRFMVTGA